MIILKWLQKKSLMYLVSYLIDADIETVLTKFRVFPGMLLIFMCIISPHELFKKNLNLKKKQQLNVELGIAHIY